MINTTYVRRKLDALCGDYGIGPVNLKIVMMPCRVPLHGRMIEGYCKPLDPVEGIPTFEIGILHTLDTDEAVVVVAHEFRHVCQHVWGWLTHERVYEDNPRVVVKLWHGVCYSHLGYWAQPWEVDARQFEDMAGDYFDE